ncbi:hypothetical protein PV326_004602 [Microctonus aethiopoides]|nr:hypothetical protein PV326_004602 [Microctonus aethiopoides]
MPERFIVTPASNSTAQYERGHLQLNQSPVHHFVFPYSTLEKLRDAKPFSHDTLKMEGGVLLWRENQLALQPFGVNLMAMYHDNLFELIENYDTYLTELSIGG